MVYLYIHKQLYVMKNLISKEEMDQIDLICKEYDIEYYSINFDGSIDVDDDVDLRYRHLEKIPLKFGTVTGYFTCSDNKNNFIRGRAVYCGW